MSSAALIPFHSTVILRGQRAWAHIKTTAAEQRLCWKEIGDALRYGRSLHKADRAFAQWVKAHGFDDIPRQVRADAMWLAENWAEVSTACTPDKAQGHGQAQGGSREDSIEEDSEASRGHPGRCPKAS